MKSQLTEPRLSRAQSLASAQRRSRWPVFLSALILVWCAGWYCRGESQGLLLLTVGLAVLAVVRPRALPGTTRWIVWGGVLLTVLCFAANVTRLVPPEHAVEESRSLDRIITVAFAVGLTALFFRLTIDGVTLVAAGGLPMAMVVLARREGLPGGAEGFEMLIVWGLVVLVIAADLAQRLTQARTAEKTAPGIGEVGRRVVFLASVAVLAFGLRLPVEWVAKRVQKGLFGWVMYPEHRPRRRTGDLFLTLPTPANFGKRMRVVLLVAADGLPGYLRERAFIQYRAGRWAVSKPESPLKEGPSVSSLPGRRVYALTPAPLQVPLHLWRVEVLAPAYMAGFCLPGNAVTLTCDGHPPLTDTSGTVAAKERVPNSYDLTVTRSLLLESAYPWPNGLSDPAYLEVPPPLAGAVSNWVSACTGLSDAPTLGGAIRRVEDHFATNFTYRLGLRMRATPDPLVDFMARKEGACTLFASAAALMFRSCGIPSRVIDGYVCGGWNPWLSRWVARERDAHAWVEVWDGVSGRWLVADPTPPDGHPDALKKPGKIRLAMDLLAAGWKRLLTYLRGANFLEVIADVGETAFLFLWEAVLSLPGAVVLAGFGVVWWLRRRTRRRALTGEARVRSELIRAMEVLERQSVPSSLRRRRSESWDAWLRRIGPALSPERFSEWREWLESYQALRYGVTLDEPAVRAWVARASRSARNPRAR
jgi:transglutaminase-like putative cysteine protease